VILGMQEYRAKLGVKSHSQITSGSGRSSGTKDVKKCYSKVDVAVVVAGIGTAKEGAL
jgi:hypothetical protein